MTVFNRHSFWRNPGKSGFPREWTEHCEPEFYLDLENVTRLIVETVTKHGKKNWSILEIGCGTGRNLVGLYREGFHRLAGVEINQAAVDLGRAHFPEYIDIPVTVAPIEDVFADLKQYDLIFTSGLLMHLPVELEWVISGLRDRARKVILINEGERAASFHAWPHPYQEIIEAGGAWKQVETHTDELYPPLPKTTVKRVFVRQPSK